MTLQPTTILELPNELLQKTFEYLDWGRSQYPVPFRPEPIVNISLTCRDLREAVLLILFRCVTLKLRWVNGALAEPGLLRLRQQCPHLTKHIKSVFVQTLFGHFRDPQATVKPFNIPKELHQWLHITQSLRRSSGHSESSAALKDVSQLTEKLLSTAVCQEYLRNVTEDVQVRFRDLAGSLCEQLLSVPADFDYGGLQSDRDAESQEVLGDETFFDDIREHIRPSTSTRGIGLSTLAVQRGRGNRELRFKLDAFFILLLCFPSRLTSMVLQSFPTDPMDTLQNQFAIQFAALVFHTYGGQLQDLTMNTSSFRAIVRLPQTGDSIDANNQTFTDALPRLAALRYLRLATALNSSRNSTTISSLGRWHSISDRITHLDLRNICGDSSDFVSFIEKFTALEVLTLGDVNLLDYRQYARTAPSPSPATFWLSFLISLRRKLRNVDFDLQDLESSQANLTTSGVRWLLEEAVSTGVSIDFERETRLVEDFESFFQLWAAEDSHRGQAAEAARQDGKLVDLAMSSRWRGLFGKN